MAFLDGLGQALKSLDCAVLGAGGYIFGSLNALQGLDAGLAKNVIDGLRRLRGCDPSNDPPLPGPPFLGGQCPGTIYNVVVTFQQPPNAPVVTESNIQGPLRLNQDLNPIPEVTGCNQSSGPWNRFSIAGSSGNSIVLGGCGLVASVTSVTPLFGGSDNCGNLPPELPPTTNLDIDVDVTFVDEGDNVVNITVPISFRPFTVNFNGDVVFPINFNLGGIDFNGEVIFAPDFSLTVRGPSFPRGLNDSDNTGDPSDDRPPAAPEALVIGAVVVVTSQSGNAATGINFVNGPNTFAPRLGSVKFAYSLGGATFWSSDIDVKGQNVFIPCPFSQGADAVAGTPVPGVEFSVTPIFGFPLATIGDIKTVLDTV